MNPSLFWQHRTPLLSTGRRQTSPLHSHIFLDLIPDQFLPNPSNLELFGSGRIVHPGDELLHQVLYLELKEFILVPVLLVALQLGKYHVDLLLARSPFVSQDHLFGAVLQCLPELIEADVA